MKAPLPGEGEKEKEDANLQEDKPLRPGDRYGRDIDGEFRPKKFPRRFKYWEEVIKTANEVLLDEMRTLLELSP